MTEQTCSSCYVTGDETTDQEPDYSYIPSSTSYILYNGLVDANHALKPGYDDSYQHILFDPGSLDNEPSHAGKIKKSNTARTKFTADQIDCLELRFAMSPHIEKVERREMAGAIGVDDAAIRTWFQNRRAKQKKLEEKAAKEEDSKDDQ